MRRFRFRLQSILDLRLHEEEQRRIELGAATQKCKNIENAIADRREQRKMTLLSRPEAHEEDAILWRRAADEYALRLSVEMSRLEESLLEAERERTVAVERYREAKQKAELLQKYRDRRSTEHHKDQQREEHNRLDEVSQYIHSRGGR